MIQFGDSRLPQRFWDKVHVNPETGCWEWTAAIQKNGYSVFCPAARKTRRGHRVAYEALVGPIHDGLEIDHLCKVRHCVNPEHLEAVTRRENIMRSDIPAIITARNASKTHCPQGHPYNNENTYVTRSGARSCRVCSRSSHKRYRSTPEYRAKHAALERARRARIRSEK